MLNQNESAGNWSISAHVILILILLSVWGSTVQGVHAESHNFKLDLVMVQMSTATYSCYNENYVVIENNQDIDQSLDNFIIDVMGTYFRLDGLTVAANNSHTYFLPITHNIFEQIQQPVADSRSDHLVSNGVTLMYVNPDSNEMITVAQSTNWSAHSAGQMVCDTFIDDIAVDTNNIITSLTLRHEDFDDANLLAAEFIGNLFENAVDDVIVAFNGELMPLAELNYVILPAPDGEPTLRVSMTPYNVSHTDPLQLMAMHPVTEELITLDTVQMAGFGAAVPLAIALTQQSTTTSAVSMLALTVTTLLMCGTISIVRRQ